jgi:CheY-like chemotaxis protein
MPQKHKQVLFVDDDLMFLEMIRNLMTLYAGDNWKIHTAPDVGAALAILQEHAIDLLVVDMQMPVVDGLQFLKLLQRKYPNLLKVALTGFATEEYRAACLSNGAELFLEKPRVEGGWQSLYATLNEFVKFQPEEGFHGVLRRVGLQDVLQMECLARSSVVLEITTSVLQGDVFIQGGQIIHAQAGERVGEDAFNYLMALTGGEFKLKPFVEPPTRTIEGSWEFLLMEAARQRDEGTQPFQKPPGEPEAAPAAALSPPVPVAQASPRPVAPATAAAPAPPEDSLRPQIDEVLICSPQGDVLYEWQCPNTTARIGFLEFLSSKARQLAQGLPLGAFDRLELQDPPRRVITQIKTDRALFIRASHLPFDGGADSSHP